MCEFFPSSGLAGGVSESSSDPDMFAKLDEFSTAQSLSTLIFEAHKVIFPIGEMYHHVLEEVEMINLKELYKLVLPDFSFPSMSSLCYRFKRAKLGNKLLSSSIAKSDSSSFISAYWYDVNGSIDLNSQRHGRIKYFIKHKLKLQRRTDFFVVDALVAYVQWYEHHPEKNHFHQPVTVWRPEFEPLAASSFMPIRRVLCRCAEVQTRMDFTERPHNSGQIVITIPLSQ